jgi:hypothetical protein
MARRAAESGDFLPQRKSACQRGFSTENDAYLASEILKKALHGEYVRGASSQEIIYEACAEGPQRTLFDGANA